MDIYTLQQSLGHRQVETTARYLHLVRPDSTVAARGAALCLLKAHPHSSSLRRLLAPAAKAQRMAAARALLAMPAANPAAAEAVNEFMHGVASIDITRCPHCVSGQWVTIGCQALLRSSHNGGRPSGNGSSAVHSSQGSATCRGPP